MLITGGAQHMRAKFCCLVAVTAVCLVAVAGDEGMRNNGGMNASVFGCYSRLRWRRALWYSKMVPARLLLLGTQS